ncbi:MAG: sensor histidine kinase, partial [Microcoleus sp.]
PVSGLLMVLKNWQKKSGESIEIPRSVLERMIQGSEQQLRLINSLLEVHAGELRGLVLYCNSVDLKAVIEAATADLEPLINDSQATLKLVISDELPAIKADATQLWRVFSNLIANALKHNPPGLNLIVSAKVIDAGELTATNNTKLERAQLPITNSSMRTLYCTVEDDGVGILPEQCEHLFDLYARGDRSRHSSGLGLGLYLCRQIINAHGGEIGVISNPNAGAIFWFTLPLT